MQFLIRLNTPDVIIKATQAELCRLLSVVNDEHTRLFTDTLGILNTKLGTPEHVSSSLISRFLPKRKSIAALHYIKSKLCTGDFHEAAKSTYESGLTEDSDDLETVRSYCIYLIYLSVILDQLSGIVMGLDIREMTHTVSIKFDTGHIFKNIPDERRVRVLTEVIERIGGLATFNDGDWHGT